MIDGGCTAHLKGNSHPNSAYISYKSSCFLCFVYREYIYFVLILTSSTRTLFEVYQVCVHVCMYVCVSVVALV